MTVLWAGAPQQVSRMSRSEENKGEDMDLEWGELHFPQDFLQQQLAVCLL